MDTENNGHLYHENSAYENSQSEILKSAEKIKQSSARTFFTFLGGSFIFFVIGMTIPAFFLLTGVLGFMSFNVGRQWLKANKLIKTLEKRNSATSGQDEAINP